MPNEETRWRAEARTFAAYLGARRVPAEIAERYQWAIQDWRVEYTRFDQWLGRFAAAHPMLTSLADAYARIARPYGDLRRRLTLMLALLETHGATHDAYDRAHPSSPAAAWLALAVSALGWGLRTILAVVICAPAHLLVDLAAPPRR